MNQLLSVKVATPQTVLFEGKAAMVSSTNSQGTFDILPQHANFITIIENQPIVIIQEDGKRLSLGFSKAILATKDDKVSIYADPQSFHH